MEDSNSIILDRLLQTAGLRRDSQLAELLGVSPQAVSQARRKGRIPDGWILKLAARLQVSTDWLCFGSGNPAPDQQTPPAALSYDTQIKAAAMSSDLPGSVSAMRVNYSRGKQPKPASSQQSTPASGCSLSNCPHSGCPLPDTARAELADTSSPATRNANPASLGNTAMLSGKATQPIFAEVPLPASRQRHGGHAEIVDSSALDVALVPLVGARLAAGAGSLETDADVQGYFAFRQDWLCRKGNPESMVLMKVFGDSMEPDIRHGDMVLVNQGHTQIFGHAIYAVGVNEEIYIKQVETRPGGLLRLRSLNPRYEPIEVNLRGDLENSVRIIGRVIWWCREA